MIKRTPQRVLGIALADGAMLVAELRGNGRRQVTRAARFDFPQGLSLEKPDALGEALGRFLRQHPFTAKAAVFGLPRRSVVIAPRKLPPAEPAALTGMLRLQAEREFGPDVGDWVCDYVPAAGAESPVLMASVSRATVKQVRRLAEAAKLHALALTEITTCLADRRDAKPGATLHLDDGGGGLALRDAAGFKWVGHVAAADHDDAAPPSLEGELRRQIMLHGQDLLTSGKPLPITLWNTSANGKLELDVLRRSGATVENGDWARAGVEAPAELHEHKWAAAPAVLGAAVMGGQKPAIDFLHARLEPPPVRRFGKLHAWGAALTAAAVIALGAMGWSLYQQQADVSALAAQLASMSNSITAARAEVDQIQEARGWFDLRPRMLECLRAMTAAFPDSGVWTTNFTLRDDMTGSLTGKAADERVVLELLDNIKTGHGFSDVKLQYLRQADRKRSEVGFAFSFRYLGVTTKD